MTKTGWLLGALAVAGIGVGIKGGCLQDTTKAPDEKLAERFDDLCEIARGNIDSPVRGVRKLGHYMGKHTGDLMADWGNTFAAIEKISDDTKHDARARLARDRIRKPLILCARDWMRFSDAVEANPEAKQMLIEFNVRFNRTLEIIFGEGQQVNLLQLPTAFGALAPAPR
jgi:hypothetical protein